MARVSLNHKVKLPGAVIVELTAGKLSFPRPDFPWGWSSAPCGAVVVAGSSAAPVFKRVGAKGVMTQLELCTALTFEREMIVAMRGEWTLEDLQQRVPVAANP